MSHGVVGVHEIPVVKEAVPVSLFNLVFIEGESLIKLFFDPFAGFGAL